METALIKLGGSVVTVKERLTTYSTLVVKSLAAEVRNYLAGGSGRRVVIVHGGGSFGHIKARKFALLGGLKESSQIRGFAEVRNDMRVLNGRIVAALIDAGAPAVSIPAETIVSISGGHVSAENFSLIDNAVERGFVPVTFGDAVFDSTIGFTVISGDVLMRSLSSHLRPAVTVFCTDVDGVFDSNPRIVRDARLVRQLTPSTAVTAGSSDRDDVTGEMGGKLSVLFDIAGKCIRTYVVNGRVKGRLSSALENKVETGTEVLAQ